MRHLLRRQRWQPGRGQRRGANDGGIAARQAPGGHRSWVCPLVSLQHMRGGVSGGGGLVTRSSGCALASGASRFCRLCPWRVPYSRCPQKCGSSKE